MGGIAPASCRRAAVFDLDRTLIRIPSVVAVAPTLYRAHLLGPAALWRAIRIGPACIRRPRDHADIDRVSEVLLSIVRGWDPDEVRRAVEAAAPRLVARIAYRQARAIIDGHRVAGDLVVVASSSPSDIAVPIAQELGADVVIATTARLSSDGRYAGDVEFLCHGQAKADAVRALCGRLGIDLQAATGYSDALADLPLLMAVGRPVATNPERRLAAVARDSGWTILDLGSRRLLGPPASRAGGQGRMPRERRGAEGQAPAVSAVVPAPSGMPTPCCGDRSIRFTPETHLMFERPATKPAILGSLPRSSSRSSSRERGSCGRDERPSICPLIPTSRR